MNTSLIVEFEEFGVYLKRTARAVRFASIAMTLLSFALARARITSEPAILLSVETW